LAVPVLGIAIFWAVFLEGRASRTLHVSIAQYQKMPLLPPLALAVRDIPRIYADQCNQEQRSPELVVCTYGDVSNPKKTVALVGSSHSAHWFPALEDLARENKWRLVVATKNGCPLTADDHRHDSCKQWNEAIIGHLIQLKPDAVFTTSTQRNPIRGRLSPEGGANGVEHVPPGYRQQWSRLAENRLAVIAIRDTPWMNVRVPACLEGTPSRGINCGRLRHEIMDEADPTSMLDPKPPNVDFIELTDQFCDQTLCPPIRKNMIIYRDGNHMTATYARSLSPLLGERMRQVRPDLFPPKTQSRPSDHKSADAG
jgi:hypothetical protein